MMSWLRHVEIVCVTAASAVLVSGCGPGRALQARLHPTVQRPPQRVVVLLGDGLAPQVVTRGCHDGWLPNIQRRFVEQGTRVENAITIVPSITYAAIASILTGVTPETHHVTGNRWFDPQRRLFRDYATIPTYRHVNYDMTAPTLHELIRPMRSASVQAAHKRGVSDNFANWAGSGVRWFFRDYTAVDKLTASTIPRIARRANENGRWPELLICYFPGIDSIGHVHGPGSKAYRDALKHFDHQVGRICDWLQRENLLEDSHVVLISDHGMVHVDEHLDLAGILNRDENLRVTTRILQNEPFQKRRKHYDNFDAVLSARDGRRALIYLKSPYGWSVRPNPSFVESVLLRAPAEGRLWNQNGIELVAYLTTETRVALRSPRGLAHIEFRPDAAHERVYRYIPVPDDVLGYLDKPALARFVSEGFQTPRAWLEATAHVQHPNVVPGIVGLLNTERGGQVVVFPQAGFSFVDELGGHGGIDREEMQTVMMIRGPGIPAGGSLANASVVDLAPTVLRWLSTSTPEGVHFDGRALDFSDVRSASDRPTQPVAAGEASAILPPCAEARFESPWFGE